MSDDIYSVVVGTAGHIDHGKSSLVLKLTGTDPDRLKEEKEKGITIDLGFASWQLPTGQKVGIIDVPGHEKFVKNMVAGATGLDLVVLVVAADDGVMPQTREHLEIMQLLGMSRGLVALTKVDKVDPELLELCTMELKEHLAGTFLADAPILPVSSITGEGYPAFEAALAQAILATPPRDATGLFRMPIQRVFSSKGHGTVVTGIPVSGQVTKGDELEIQPAGVRGRVRSIQAYKAQVESARAGHSTALNMSDVDYEKVRRGMVAATPGYFAPHAVYEAEFTYLASSKKPLHHHQPVRFHTGTSEVTGRIYLLEGSEIEPGARALVQFQLDEPIVAAAGDRYVVRQDSPIVTIGGGQLVGVAERRGGRRRDVATRVQQKAESLGDPRAQLKVLVAEAGPAGTTDAALKAALQLKPAEQRALVDGLTKEGAFVRLQGGRLVATSVLSHFEKQCVALLEQFHREHPKQIYCEAIELRNAMMLDPVFFEELLGRLEAVGTIERDRSRIRQRGRALELSPEERELYQSLLIVFRDGGFNSPRPAELPRILGSTAARVQPVIALALERGDLIHLEENVMLERSHVHRVIRLVIAQIKTKGEVISGELRDQLGTSRKYIIPLLEHLDKIGLTMREGSQRVLRREYAKVLAREGLDHELPTSPEGLREP